jgi:hypothetical protein
LSEIKPLIFWSRKFFPERSYQVLAQMNAKDGLLFLWKKMRFLRSKNGSDKSRHFFYINSNDHAKKLTRQNGTL